MTTILLKVIFIEILNILLCKSDNEIYDGHTILYFNIVSVIFGQNMKKTLQLCIARKYHELQSIYIHVNLIM